MRLTNAAQLYDHLKATTDLDGATMVDAATFQWRKSRASMESADCVEVAALPDHQVGIRDSKNPDGPTITVDMSGFRSLLDTIRTSDGG